MTDSAVLWYLNRATGTVLLALLTLTVALGVLATFGRAGRGVPRFLTQAFHRNVSLITVAMLTAHVLSAVLDTFVDIRWWQAVVPFGASYKPVWLGLGALAFDAIVVVVLTSLVRTRMGHRSWRAVHLLGYVAWAAAVVHGFGIGTDAHTGWSRIMTLGCVGVVGLVAAIRTAVLVTPERHDQGLGSVR